MITKDSLNPHLLRAEYAVRGPIVQRAQQLEEQGRKIIYSRKDGRVDVDPCPFAVQRQTHDALTAKTAKNAKKLLPQRH